MRAKSITNENDPRLRALLMAWTPRASLPPRFREQVWRRIECMELARISSVPLARLVADWIGARLPRPALAVAYVSLLLAIGAGLGWTRARLETATVFGELGARYVSAVDPYQDTP